MNERIKSFLKRNKNWSKTSINEFENLTRKERLMVLVSITIKGNLETVPKCLLKEENIIPEELQKTNLLHVAISEDQLYCLPQKLLTVPNLLLKDEMLKSSYELAADMGKFDDIPNHCICREVLEMEDNGNTLLHKLAKTNQLNTALKEMMTLEMVFRKDQHHTTILEYAIRTGSLEYIPNNCLRGENLLKTLNEETVLHLIAREGEIERISRKDFTSENLSKKGRDGFTVLMHVLKTGNYEKIPKDSITEELLLIKNDLGQNIFEILFNQAIEPDLSKHNTAYIASTIKSILPILSQKNLERVKEKSLEYGPYLNKHCNLSETIAKEIDKKIGIERTKKLLREEISIDI